MMDKDFLTSIYGCVFYLLVSFTDNLNTCNVHVLKTQELELNENCCHRRKPPQKTNNQTNPYTVFHLQILLRRTLVLTQMMRMNSLLMQSMKTKTFVSRYHFECLKRLLLLCKNGASICIRRSNLN